MGCEVCSKGEQVLYQETRYVKMYINTFGKARTILINCEGICPPNENCCMKDVPARSAFIINYCPNCGRNLSEGEEQQI